MTISVHNEMGAGSPAPISLLKSRHPLRATVEPFLEGYILCGTSIIK